MNDNDTLAAVAEKIGRKLQGLQSSGDYIATRSGNRGFTLGNHNDPVARMQIFVNPTANGIEIGYEPFTTDGSPISSDTMRDMGRKARLALNETGAAFTPTTGGQRLVLNGGQLDTLIGEHTARGIVQQQSESIRAAVTDRLLAEARAEQPGQLDNLDAIGKIIRPPATPHEALMQEYGHLLNAPAPKTGPSIHELLDKEFTPPPKSLMGDAGLDALLEREHIPSSTLLGTTEEIAKASHGKGLLQVGAAGLTTAAAMLAAGAASASEGDSPDIVASKTLNAGAQVGAKELPGFRTYDAFKQGRNTEGFFRSVEDGGLALSTGAAATGIGLPAAGIVEGAVTVFSETGRTFARLGGADVDPGGLELAVGEASARQQARIGTEFTGREVREGLTNPGSRLYKQITTGIDTEYKTKIDALTAAGDGVLPPLPDSMRNADAYRESRISDLMHSVASPAADAAPTGIMRPEDSMSKALAEAKLSGAVEGAQATDMKHTDDSCKVPPSTQKLAQAESKSAQI